MASPGSWRVIKSATDATLILDCSGGYVAEITREDKLTATDHANARVIGAAADLLAACEAALLHLQPEVEDEVTEEREGRATRLHDMLLAAIAKARGE